MYHHTQPKYFFFKLKSLSLFGEETEIHSSKTESKLLDSIYYLLKVGFFFQNVWLVTEKLPLTYLCGLLNCGFVGSQPM
jgi:hypothetical protein